MARRHVSFSTSDARRACRAAPDRVVEINLPDGTVIKLIPGEDKPEVAKPDQARNAAGNVEARLADAPWAKSK